ncbi:hypothetical protein JCM8547_002815 [Rhodosporidiobolus lusitaniae]
MPPRRKSVKAPPASSASSTAPPPPSADPSLKGTNRYLPAADAELFRQILQLYENKDNAKGLEIAQDVLSRHPDHGGEPLPALITSLMDGEGCAASKQGIVELLERSAGLLSEENGGLRSRRNRSEDAAEQSKESYWLFRRYWTSVLSPSLCMKGIFLHGLNRKPEGYDFVERGAKKDPGSHIVWHVHALMRRADKQFEEALKCYTKACEIEKDSLNLLNDLSTLTIHLRHYPQYVSVRLQILRVQPRMRRNWLALAVAQFLASDHTAACTTLAYYENMLRDVPEGDVEMSEVLLFHAKVLEEAGEREKCLEFLTEKQGQITDKAAYGVQRARILLALNRTESALWAWEALLGENPESREYIRSTVLAKGADCDATTLEGREAAIKVLDELSAQYPRSLAIKRLALDLSSGDVFRTKASDYLLSALSKGVPSLFADIKALYKFPGGEGAEKCRVVGEIVEGFRKELEESGRAVKGDDDSLDAPSTYLWTLYFLSSHHSHPSNPSSSQPLALQTLHLAESHTPSLPELSMLRARILKRAGDAQGAARSMEEARVLDLQDRFLNAKACKYFVRAGDCRRAEEVAALFTKKDAPSPLEDLVEMQCLWFLQEEGDAYKAEEDWGRALRRYHQILNIFQEIEEDQYDFHAYCMRKSTLNAYVDMLRWATSLRTHPRFSSSAASAIRLYLAMHDSPSSFPQPAAVQAADATDAGESKEKEEEVVNVYRDTDPLGLELLSAALSPSSSSTSSSPALAQAKLFLTPLLRVLGSSSSSAQILAAEVALREGGAKLLEALKALRTAKKIAGEKGTPELLAVTVRFVRAVEKAKEGGKLNSSVLAVLSDGMTELTGGKDVVPRIDEELQKNGGGKDDEAEWIVAAAEAKSAAGVSEEEVGALVKQVAEREDLQAGLKTTLRAFSLLSPTSPSRDSFRTAAASRFPLARAFKTTEELAKLDEEAEREKEEEEGKEIVGA